MDSKQRQLVGNRLALVGAVVYLLEWVVIIAANPPGPVEPGTKPAEMLARYAAHSDGQALLAGWLSVVLLGRIAFAVGVRGSLRQSPKELLLADLAVGAMGVSVIVEIATYAVAGAAGWLAGNGADATAVVALDGAAGWLNQMIYAPLGVCVGVMSVAMLSSRLFPAWICWLGLVAGTAGVVYGALAGLDFGATGALHNAGQVLMAVGVLGFWVWMLATGILLFRHAGRLPELDTRDMPPDGAASAG